ncbi:MAG TPA: hypothetical protein VMZ27_10065 [Candidatus Saccharimonadales bacterium]|nr:hypothetical protein [Candidatus Saccharimonadales bacterium]
MAFRLQEFIHKYEVGAGARVIKMFLAAIALITLGVLYDSTGFRNMTTAEGMDAAQLGQRIADGKGFTTGLIRPLSLFLLAKGRGDPEQILRPHEQKAVTEHPDLANGPVYPLVLSAVLKLSPVSHLDVTTVQQFQVYKPDLWLAILNQCFIGLGAFLVLRLGRRLFDEQIGWFSAAVFAGAELFWRASLGCVPGPFLAVVFLLLFSIMTSLQEEQTTGRLWRAFLAGLLIAIAGLTRYSYGILLVPFLFWIGGLPGEKKGLLIGMTILGFALAWSPWVVRNYTLSGTPFGTAGFALYQGTPLFPEDVLERTLNPDFSTTDTSFFWAKMLANLRESLAKLPTVGGSWASSFFLAGLLMVFRKPSLRRVRLFLLWCLGALLLTQALGRTWQSTDAPDISGENLLLPLAPIAFIYGTGFLFILLEQMGLPNAGYRLVGGGIFAVLVSAPFLLGLLPPHPSPLVYPPYYPPWIQDKAAFTKGGGLMMTDIPWAVSWYGDVSPNIWIPPKYKTAEGSFVKNDFFEVNGHPEPVKALYLSDRTLKTIDMRALYNYVQHEDLEQDWDHFVLGIFAKKEVPNGFPLKHAPEGLIREIFLTDSERPVRK